MTDHLLASAAEVDITPPVGTAMAGSLRPRTSVGVRDPLCARAIVLESNGERIAYVLLDLVKLYRKEGDRAVALAAEATGIPESNIVWAASHTHSGPYVGPMFGAEEGGVDEEWLATVPGKFAEAVEKADEAKKPATASFARGYCMSTGQNRRFRFKDGRELNGWCLNRGEEDVQCLGTAAPIDPEVGALSFDGEDGAPIAILWHYTLHTNVYFGSRFSADYPAVVTEHLRKRFGNGVVPVFLPGACGDINTICSPERETDDPDERRWAVCEAVGKRIAHVMLSALEKKRKIDGAPALAALKEEMTVPYRDLNVDQEKRIRASQWGEQNEDVFRNELEIMRKEGETEAGTIIQAWRIGDIGFASLPGEVFVEWGLKIKEESPFPWTFPVELGGDYLGYIVTEQAWKAGGYESLIARSARPSVEGCAAMTDKALELLRKLYGG